MTRGKQHYLDNILEDAWVRVYASTNTAMFEYPYLLGHPESYSPTLAEMSQTYIMDSKIGDESVTNEDVLEKGQYVDADVITPADVLEDPATTTARTIDLFTQLADIEYSPEVLVPLQPVPGEGKNHYDHFCKLRPALEDHGIELSNHRLSIGGVKNMTSVQQLEAVVSVRQAVGDEQFLHGLGFGASHDWVTVMREYPWLLDSIDMTSVIRDVIQAGRLFTPQASRVEYRMPRGKNSTVLTASLREFALYLMSYLLGPHPREEDVPNEITNEDLLAVLEDNGLYKHRDADTIEQATAAD